MSDRVDHLEAQLLAMRRRMRRLTATNLVLAVAVLGFGGAGAAYALAAANSVNSASIIDGTIITQDLKTGALSGSKILDNAVTGTDVNEATLVLTCPPNTTMYGDVCAGAPREADDQDGARLDCADEGLRLPSISEATVIALSTQAGGGWTDVQFYDGVTANRAVYSPNASGLMSAYEQTGTPNPYRCVTTVGARP